jgi:hypothetical protein
VKENFNASANAAAVSDSVFSGIERVIVTVSSASVTVKGYSGTDVASRGNAELIPV